MIKTPNPIDIRVGKLIRMRRMSVGITQEKMGEAIGVTFQQVQKYENGKNRVSASRLQQIADLLGVTPAFFFDQDGPGEGASASPSQAVADDVAAFLGTKEGQELVHAFRAIKDPAVRRRFLDLAEAIAAEQGGVG